MEEMQNNRRDFFRQILTGLAGVVTTATIIKSEEAHSEISQENPNERADRLSQNDDVTSADEKASVQAFRRGGFRRGGGGGFRRGGFRRGGGGFRRGAFRNW